MGYPIVRREIRSGFEKLLQDWLADCDVVVGTATAGIPHAAWLAESQELPMAYVRSSAKAHGKRNLIEGPLAQGSRVVIIEDLISTGGSCIAAATAVREVGANVLGVGSIFTYELSDAVERFQDAGSKYRSLTGNNALLAAALDSGKVTVDEVESVRSWKRDPRQWKAS